jgi:hypothetical protein
MVRMQLYHQSAAAGINATPLLQLGSTTQRCRLRCDGVSSYETSQTAQRIAISRDT